MGQLIFGNSYAATVAWPTSHPSLPEMHMQVSVRDAGGNLIAYFEPTLWYIADLNGLHSYLDTKPNKVIVNKEGKKYEKIKFVETHMITSNAGQITSEPIYYNGNAVLMPRHDGVITEPGYRLDISWNIVRIIR